MGLGLGGITTPPCVSFWKRGLIKKLVDTRISIWEPSSPLRGTLTILRSQSGVRQPPFNREPSANKLDFVILASPEVDVDLYCNVVVGSDGMITGFRSSGWRFTPNAPSPSVGRAICTMTTVTTPARPWTWSPITALPSTPDGKGI